MRYQHTIQASHRKANFIGARRGTCARIDDEKFISRKNTDALLRAGAIAHGRCRAAKSNFEFVAAPIIVEPGQYATLNSIGNQSVLHDLNVHRGEKNDHGQNNNASPNP